jgi:hypothetical protein
MKISLKLSVAHLWYFFITIALLVAFFYNSYRYPLQINAASTSPTYSQTPFMLKVGKYIIFSALYAVLIFIRLYRLPRLKIGNWQQALFFVIVLFLSVFPIIVGVLNKNIPTLETGFFFLVALVFHLFKPFPVPISRIVSLLKWVTIIAIIYNFAQVLLFFAIDRLPALAYKNSISVRFGGLLDDPNGFGIMLALFMGFSYIYFNGLNRIFILGSLGLSLLLTQSLTALGAIIVAVVLVMLGYMFFTYKASKTILWSGILLLLFLVFLVASFFDEILAFIQLFLLLKAGSIEAHAGTLDVLIESNFLHWLGLQSMNGFSETGYINLIINLGGLYTVFFLIYGLFAIYKYFLLFIKSEGNRQVKSIALAGLLYLSTVYLGMLNLPLEQVYPVNAITAFFLGLVHTQYYYLKELGTELKKDE